MVVGTADRNIIVYNLQNPQVTHLSIFSIIHICFQSCNQLATTGLFYLHISQRLCFFFLAYNMIKEDLFQGEDKLHEDILSSKGKKTDNQISGPVVSLGLYIRTQLTLNASIHPCNIAISMDGIAPKVQIPQCSRKLDRDSPKIRDF